jgi:hypothetical protein
VKAAALFLVSGAPGSGKTALIPHLVQMTTHVVVMDMDDLLEEGSLLGIPIAVPESSLVWPTYNRIWVRITRLVRRSHIPVLLLCPILPMEAIAAGVGDDDPEVHWGLLDCAATEQAQRLEARGWTGAQIEEAISDAERARAAITTVFHTDQGPPEQTARDLLAWVAAS